jgi:hypothetical protein
VVNLGPYKVSKKPITILRLTSSSTLCKRARRRRNSSSLFKILASLLISIGEYLLQALIVANDVVMS